MYSRASRAVSMSMARVARMAMPAAQQTAAAGMATAASQDIPSFARGLFRGEVESAVVHPFPDPLGDDEREMLSMSVDPMGKFLADVNDPAANDRNGKVSDETHEGLKQFGSFGMMVPEEYGGVGLSNTGYARMVEIVGQALDLGLGIHLGAHQSIGYKGIVLFGTDAQKEKYLPDLATGEKMAAFVLTEPTAGSDANSIRTRATQNEDGSWSITGNKIYISNGGIAEVFTVFAQTEVDDPKNPGQKKDKVTAFIVERGFGGITSGPPEKKMGIKASNTTTLDFDNTRVPAENVIGEVGGGFKVAMAILNNGRFGMGAALSGVMKSVIATAQDYAANRDQFGRKLKTFGIIQQKFADMALKLYACESLAYMVAGAMDLGSDDYQLEAACSKILASEAAWFVTDECIQVLGGAGFMSDVPYERVLRDLRIFRIFEGTNDILRLFVALNGFQTLGKEMGGVVKALKSPLANLGVLAPFGVTLAKDKLGMPDKPSLSWAAPELRDGAAAIEQATASFGSLSRELLMKHGKNILEQQMVLERVADCVIDLTAATASLARATRAVENKLPSAEHEVLLANTFALEALARSKANIRKARGSAGAARVQKNKAQIAADIFENEGPAATPVLGF